MKLFSRGSVCALLLGSVLLPAAWAQDLASFEKAVTEFTLDNGMHFIVLERHHAPVVSFNTYANAGSADDPSGLTGLAHMFEHMAFKGTPKIGSTDYGKEQRALDAVDQTYDALQGERHKGPRADEKRLAELEGEFDQAVEEAAKLANSSEYTRIIEENGGTGLNAGTSLDSTVYFNRLPSTERSFGSISSRSAFCVRFFVTSTRSGTLFAKNGACARNPTRWAG